MKPSSLCLLVILLFACSSSDEEPGTPPSGLIEDLTLTVNGIPRTYTLYVPTAQNNSPVVLLLHGKSDDAAGLLGVDPTRNSPYRLWQDIADRENLILVVPNGGTNNSGVQGWNDCRGDGSGNPGFDDSSFIAALLDEVASTYSVDANRVYVNGTSNGGHLAYRLAQEIPDRLTAIAMVIAANPGDPECVEANIPISVLIMNGTGDPIMPYTGGIMAFNRGSVLSTDESIQYWVDRNKTDPTPDFVLVDDINTDDGSYIERFHYTNGTNQTEVLLYRIISGGHTEPSIVERYNSLFLLAVGAQNGDIEMAEEIWSFFKGKSK